jgi:hypothetical protein
MPVLVFTHDTELKNIMSIILNVRTFSPASRGRAATRSRGQGHHQVADICGLGPSFASTADSAFTVSAGCMRASARKFSRKSLRESERRRATKVHAVGIMSAVIVARGDFQARTPHERTHHRHHRCMVPDMVHRVGRIMSVDMYKYRAALSARFSTPSQACHTLNSSLGCTVLCRENA